jgi:hypothetical protein
MTLLTRDCPMCKRPMPYTNEISMRAAEEIGTICGACCGAGAKQPVVQLETTCHSCKAVRVHRDRKRWKRYVQAHPTPESRLCSPCYMRTLKERAARRVKELPLFEREVKASELWARDVKERDGHTCKACGKSRDVIQVDAHHVHPVHRHPFICLELDNGVTLCVLCHQSAGGVHGEGEPLNDVVSHLRRSLLE